MSNPLVAEVQPSVKPEDGVAIVDFSVDAGRAASEGDWCEAGINVVNAASDVTSMVTDPFGTLLSSAFAWAMEHVDPLPDMLDALAGNPDAVQANAQTWGNVADALGTASEDMKQAVEADCANWQGPAIDVYKVVGAGEAMMVQGASAAANAVGAAVAAAGVAVTAVRTTVRDLIAEAMAELVKWLAKAAVAAGVTLGLATPVLVADVIRIVAKWANKVKEWLDKIVTSFKALSEIVTSVHPALDKVATIMSKAVKAADTNGAVAASDYDDKPVFA